VNILGRSHGFAIRAGFILIATVMLMAACGDDDSDVAGDPTPTVFTLPFDGDLEPKARTNRTEFETVPSPLNVVESSDHGSFSRFTFFFGLVIPSYDLRYVDSAIACGSGAPLDIEGEAFLELSLNPATGFDPTGDVGYVFRPEDIVGGLPSVLDFQLSCNFEGELTWVFGLPEPLDYPVFRCTVARIAQVHP
jgi:hypothetical protein